MVDVDIPRRGGGGWPQAGMWGENPTLVRGQCVWDADLTMPITRVRCGTAASN